MSLELQDHETAAHEVVDVLLEKINRLPIADRSLIIIASIEAVAWAAGLETRSHCRKKGLDDSNARARIDEYAMLFITNANRALPKDTNKA